MAKTEKNEVKLKKWQEAVIEEIEKHEEARSSEQYVQMQLFLLNQVLGVTIRFPHGAGHTFLARYIAEKYPTVVVYTDIAHYHEFDGEKHARTETISAYEIHFAMTNTEIRQPSEHLQDITRRIGEKKVVVVDCANRIPKSVKDYLYNIATGIVIMLE